MDLIAANWGCFLLGILGGALTSFGVIGFALRRKTKPVLVDRYTIRLVDDRSMKFVHLAFEAESGAVQTYRFAPAYAHRLSDELCMASARAAAPADDGEPKATTQLAAVP